MTKNNETVPEKRGFRQEQSETFHFCEEKPLHHYRTEIPNCVLKAKLDPYTFRIYCHIKMIAGDSGNCWQSIATIAKECDISECQVRRCISKLCEVNEFLECPLLIKIERKRKDGNNETNVYRIVDVWKLNTKVHQTNRNNNSDDTDGGVYNGEGRPYQREASTIPKRDKEDLFKNGLAGFQKMGSPTNKAQPETVNPDRLGSAAPEVQKEKIFYKTRSGKVLSITRSDIHRHFLNKYSPEVITMTIKEFEEEKAVGNAYSLLEVIADRITFKISNQNKPKKQNKQGDSAVGFRAYYETPEGKAEYARLLEEHNKKPKYKFKD